MRKRRLFGWLVPLLLVLPGCRGTRVPPLLVEVPAVDREGLFASTAWLDDRRIAVDYGPPNSVLADTSAWLLNTKTGEFSPMRLPHLEGCQTTFYTGSQRLADGRLGLIQHCILEDFSERYAIVSVDPDTLDIQRLTPYKDDTAPVDLTWQAGSGFGSDSSRLCATLLRLTPEAIDYANLKVSYQGRTFVIGRRLLGENDCDDQPRAEGPALSPDGGLLAFFFSPQSIGVSGIARLDAPWSLVVHDLRSGSTRVLVDDIINPSSILWSGPGRTLMFGGGVGSDNTGTWTTRYPDGRLTQVSGEGYGGFDISPDGSRIVAVTGLRLKGIDPRNKLVFLDDRAV